MQLYTQATELVKWCQVSYWN